MSNQVISYADLSIINSALKTISSNMSNVHSELGQLNFKQDQLESELVKLSENFANFVKFDVKNKALQLAETRQGNLKQDLQIKFGYYAEVRRMATGILQAVDTSIVTDNTLQHATEEMMIKAPGYWLAPALIALAAWIRNEKSGNEKALQEALKRDDYKTSLFFMLVMRRLARNEASLKWLERYFIHQNPHSLDREFIVVLEAVTTGVFPPASRQLMMNIIKTWLDQLMQDDSYINKQKEQWVSFFEAMGPLYDGKYPLLEKYATNWITLEQSLKEAKTHAVLQNHIKSVISYSSDFSKGIKVQLDEILSLLVLNFDDEELPLQEEVRLNQLIIKMDGDKAAAQSLIDVEKHIFLEKVDFLQLLTNTCFNPELSGVTKATQALAISISQPWIVESHDEFTAKNRNSIPQNVDLSVDNFVISTKDGSDENDILTKQEEYYIAMLNKQLKELSLPIAGIIIGMLVCLLGFWAFDIHIIVGFAGICIGGALISNSIHKYNKAKKVIKDNVDERKRKAKEVIRGCIAECVDYRREYIVEDQKAEELRHLLKSIKPEDFSSVSKDTARNII